MSTDITPVALPAGITKVGPWGGDGGEPWDTGRLGTRLATIRIRFTYGEAWDTGHIDFLRFQYELNGKLQWSEEFGTYDLGEMAEIDFEEGEHLGFILGHTGEGGGAPTVVKSLTFVSNLRKYGPYGGEAGKYFCLPKSENNMIVGFHGRSDKLIDALGVYLAPVPIKAAGITKVGPWGGDTGEARDTGVPTGRLARIKICHNWGIVYLRFQYELDGKLQWSDSWGSFNAAHLSEDEIVLEEGEYLGFIMGHIGDSRGNSDAPAVVRSLTFVSNLRIMGPYGGEDGKVFCLPKFENDMIVGFHGRSGTVIDAIGVYLAPIPAKLAFTACTFTVQFENGTQQTVSKGFSSASS